MSSPGSDRLHGHDHFHGHEGRSRHRHVLRLRPGRRPDADTLGWEVRGDLRFGAQGEYRSIEVAPPGSVARLALNPPSGGTPGGAAIGVEVDDVLAEHARLSAVGGLDLDPEPMQMAGTPLMFALRDPDGNHVWIVSPS
jgi:lactoylglutathione lyase